jgi:hypothetical protein
LTTFKKLSNLGAFNLNVEPCENTNHDIVEIKDRIMSKIEDKIERRVIEHELGHLFTLVLFSKLGISHRVIKSLSFYTYTQVEGMVKSEGPIDEINEDWTCEEILKIRELVLPSVINSLSGYVFETIFDTSESFEHRFERKYGYVLNKDFRDISSRKTILSQHVNSIKPMDFYHCVELGNEYIRFLSDTVFDELNKIVSEIAALDFHNDGGEMTIQEDKLQAIISRIESIMTNGFIKKANEWFIGIKGKYSLQFKDC